MSLLRYQKRWKVTIEDGEDVIRGKRGVIALYESGDMNIWIVNTRIANKIVWKPLHTYDDGADYARKIDDLDVACGYIKARKRRILSAEQREKLVARLATMRSLRSKATEQATLANE